MNNKSPFTRAFTLVELLVAIAIISLLTGIIVANLSSSRSKARDAKRISDMSQLQLALELFFDRCKQYPSVGGGSTGKVIDLSISLNNGCPGGVSLETYISSIPTPPTGSYDYAVNNLDLPRDYFLHTSLENTSEIIKDGLSAVPFPLASPPPTPTCANTSASTDYCIGPK